MKEGQKLWTREETILAINLYCKIPFGQMHSRNGAVVDLAILIHRTPASVARKLGNLASLDPKLQQQGIKGLPNISKLDREVWQDYMHNWDEQFIEGEQLLADKKAISIEQLNDIDLDNLPAFEGREKQRLIKTRINQHLFRRIVLSNYNNQCCITGIAFPELLVASHILPWSVDKVNRLNPANGLSLNNLHDKAFDSGLITLTDDFKVKISSKFYKHKSTQSIQDNFIQYDGQALVEPKKFLPDTAFLKIHQDRFMP